MSVWEFWGRVRMLVFGFPKQGPPLPASQGAASEQGPASACLAVDLFEGASWEVLQCPALQMGTCSPLVQALIHSHAIAVTHLSFLS